MNTVSDGLTEMARTDAKPEAAPVYLERLSGGRGIVREGDIVTPKPRSGYETYGGYFTVDKPSEKMLGGEFMGLKNPAGKRYNLVPDLFLLTTHSELQARAQLESVREMVQTLKDAELSQNEDVIESAREAIQQDALSVEVRSGWVALGSFGPHAAETPKAAEFKILLCTGGPAVQIVGELDEHGEPKKPRLQHQDWGTPWTDYSLSAEDEETLLAYCREFYFGEG